MVEVTRSNWFNRLGKSVVGIIIGSVLFFGSFVLLYWNEGRVDLSKVAKTAIEVDAIKNVGADHDKPVRLSGEATSSEVIGDDLILIPGKYLYVNRKAEVYAWTERKESETKKDTVGGGETTTTHYYYEKLWVNQAENDGNFNSSEKHDYENKHNERIDNTKALQRVAESGSKQVETIIMGHYTMNTSNLIFPSPQEVTNLEGKLDLSKLNSYGKEIKSKYLYVRKASGTTGDQVGDERMSFSVVNYPFKGCAFGKLDGTELKIYNVDIAMKNKATLFHLFDSDCESAITILYQTFQFWLWFCRMAGFLMMFIGLMLVFDLISTVLDIIGIIGDISRFLINTILFVLALSLSIITIVVSAIVHNLIVLIVTLLGGGIIALILIQKKKKIE